MVKDYIHTIREKLIEQLQDEMDGSGRTTRLIEEAISLLSKMPDGYVVIITGAHPRWLRELEREFKEAGLVDVIFMSPQQIIQGRMRGLRGLLLIDDFQDLPRKEQVYILDEQRHLKRLYGHYGSTLTRT
jgi:hypothetical protein